MLLRKNFFLFKSHHFTKSACSSCRVYQLLFPVRHNSNPATKLTDKNQNDVEDDSDVIQHGGSEVLHISSNKNPSFPSLIKNVELKDGLRVRISKSEVVLPVAARLMRSFITPEMMGNWWESAIALRKKSNDHYNLWPHKEKSISMKHEVGIAKLVATLGGAMKLVDADRWVDNALNLRARNKRDIKRLGTLKVDALDFRGSGLNYNGCRLFDHLAHIRYLNVGDCKYFDNHCLSRINSLSETLEYLDLSGTKVTAEGLTYLRLYPNLKWLNLSQTTKEIREIVPYILEILPPGCTVVVDDDRSALEYGSEIPFQHPSDPEKDHIFLEDPGLGEVALFEERYGLGVYNPSDVTHVHQLWKTPVLSKKRLKAIAYSSPPNQGLRQKFLYHAKEAEKLPPLI